MSDIEQTLVLVKPDGVARNLTGEILRRIEAKGYQLLDIRMVHADRELLAAHYAEHEGKTSVGTGVLPSSKTWSTARIHQRTPSASSRSGLGLARD